MTNAAGSTRSEAWEFAAGDWPFDETPIPILANGPVGKRINICFVADKKDYTEGPKMMLGDLESLIFDGYHTNNGIRGRNRQYWQFYYSPATGFLDEPGGTNEIPDSVELAPIQYLVGIVHRTDRVDWALPDQFFGTEWDHKGTAVHESAHTVFGLADEYASGGHWTSLSGPSHNNYLTKSGAEGHNVFNGWNAGEAEEIEEGWWRPEPTSLVCVMWQDGKKQMRDFARTCLARTVWFYSQL